MSSLAPAYLQRLQDDEVGDDPLLDELKVLRRRIFHWHGRCAFCIVCRQLLCTDMPKVLAESSSTAPTCYWGSKGLTLASALPRQCYLCTLSSHRCYIVYAERNLLPD